MVPICVFLPAGKSQYQPIGVSSRFTKTCLVSRYSSSPHGPSSRPKPTKRSDFRIRRTRQHAAPKSHLRGRMFVTATFHGQKKETRGAVPASAILHLHDRDWVYVPAG